METLVKYEVVELIPPVHGYRFNVRELISIDGGESYFYTGNGHFCKELRETIKFTTTERCIHDRR